jgi:hypothetical protein
MYYVQCTPQASTTVSDLLTDSPKEAAKRAKEMVKGELKEGIIRTVDIYDLPSGTDILSGIGAEEKYVRYLIYRHVRRGTEIAIESVPSDFLNVMGEMDSGLVQRELKPPKPVS